MKWNPIFILNTLERVSVFFSPLLKKDNDESSVEVSEGESE